MLPKTELLHTLLCWSIVAFVTSTVILSVQNAKIKKELHDVQAQIDCFESVDGSSKTQLKRVLLDSVTQTTATVNDYRLPQSVLPLHYNLYLHPDIETGNYAGQEVITLRVHEATKQIVLHAHQLTITSLYVQKQEGWLVGDTLEVDDYEFDMQREFLIINMAQELEEQSIITLGIIFEGRMQGKIVGLYSSSYLTPQQATRRIATTKFEPTYARQAFPCFDEPAMKATFNITVAHPTGSYHALSNMNLEETQYWGQYSESYFATSVPMSTYLACIIVSDFEYEQKSVKTHGIGSNFDIRAYATAHQLHKVTFALDTAVAVTEFYIQYYNVAYPLPKLDMAAIPDFASNAMEHWGLVTYRETALLYDVEYSSTSNKQRIASVLAHELAHMWFGNLVTMKWWNDLWLNEGFARYMQYKGVDAIYTTWGMMDQFLVHALHSVLVFDSKVSSHPIVQTVETPNQITEIFDTISYDKGGSVIRMLENAVGSQIFSAAVTSYLQKYKYANAVTEDFLSEFDNFKLDFDVKQMMRTWTEQMGFPVIEVKRTVDNEFVITQQRFFSNIADYDRQYADTEFNSTWTIPLTYFTDLDDEAQFIIFNYDTRELRLKVSNTQVKWIKFNAEQVGYYRVNYEHSLWRAIIGDLVDRPARFAIADRAHLLNDAFALADASQLSYSIALDMTAYLEKEIDFVPWYVAAQQLQELRRNLMYTEIFVQYVEYARELLAKIYTAVTWNVDADNHLKNWLRVTVLTAACDLGLANCLHEAQQRFASWLAEPERKPAPDLREIVYYYGMQQANSEVAWERMLQLFQQEQDASEKLKLMYGLSAVRSPQLLYRFIELAEDETYIRRQDYFTCIQNIAANPVGEPVVWDYVREHWPDLVSRFGLNDRYLGRMIPAITKRFASQVKLAEVQQFFAKYPEAGAGTASRQQALETIKYNIQWLQQNQQEIADWLGRREDNLYNFSTI